MGAVGEMSSNNGFDERNPKGNRKSSCAVVA